VKRLPLILLVLAVLVFAGGLWRLFQLRFESGDVYPQYSTLRADPLGAKAFHDALGRVLRVRRDFRPHLETGEGPDTTLFLLGIPDLEERYALEDLQELENFAAAGGRVVISFLPRFTAQPSRWREGRPPPAPTNSASAKPAAKQPRPGRRPPTADKAASRRLSGDHSMGERWRFGVQCGVAEHDEKGVYQPVVAGRKGTLFLPEQLEWHTAAWFDKPDPAWQVIYAREKDRALVMKRKLGAGTLVLLADSFYFSNEAMRWHRQPELLAWLTGPNHQAVFDESHLGVQERPGVAGLARKYRLHGLVLSLLVLGALFVWKNSAPFLPEPEAGLASGRGDYIRGKESSSGFVNLLRRNIRASDVLGLCFEEWKKTCARSVPSSKLEELEDIMRAEKEQPARKRNAVAAYQACRAILARTGAVGAGRQR
jgi:hypothetical protein